MGFCFFLSFFFSFFLVVFLGIFHLHGLYNIVYFQNYNPGVFQNYRSSNNSIVLEGTARWVKNKSFKT